MELPITAEASRSTYQSPITTSNVLESLLDSPKRSAGPLEGSLITNINFKSSNQPKRLTDTASNLRTNPTYISNNVEVSSSNAWNSQEAYARFDKLLHNIQFSPLSKPKFNNRNYNYYDPKSSKNDQTVSVPSQKSNNDNKRSLSIPYRPFHPVFFNENDSTVDQLLDELNMAEEYSNDRKRSRDRNSQTTVTDHAMAFNNSSYWERIPTVLSEGESNSYLNKNTNAYSRYRDIDAKKRSSTATADTSLFHNSLNNTEIEQSPKRSIAASILLGQLHNEATGNESSGVRSSYADYPRNSMRIERYDTPSMTNSSQYNFVNLNATKRKNNLSKAMISSNLNASITESERLAKTDLFLLPSDDSGNGHLFSGMTDASPSADCSALIESVNDITSSESRVRRLMEPKSVNSTTSIISKPKERSTERPNSS